VGRIRKALSITSVIATGGALGTPVKWESNAEKAAREQAKLLKDQNALLARIAANGQSPAPGMSATSEVAAMCCLDCLNHGCDKAMGGKVEWTRILSKCDCRTHHL
jgi:hypothetical protein